MTEFGEISAPDAAAVPEVFSTRVRPIARPRIVSERTIIVLVGAIQFVNILDFMIVMPLGPDFAAALGISTSHIGIIGGSYTAAAALAGLAGAAFLDRFDRRIALGVAMLGLVVGTALGGFANGLVTMIAARVVAGSFGGPATSLALAIIADTIPAERRGKALGAVMGAFSVASVLGVPAGLELAARFGWRTPFFAVAAMGLAVTSAALWFMPPMRGHLTAGVVEPRAARPSAFDALAALSITNVAVVMLSVFAVVPNISAFVQHNLGYPRDRIGLLYLTGGIASFIAMRIVGSLVDRVGATRMVTLGTGIYGIALYFGFIQPLPWIPVLLVFTLFMVSGSARMVPLQTLATRVPRAHQRARYMSAQSSAQHLASAIGAIAASLFLLTRPDGSLGGMDRVAWVSLALACLVPVGAARVERWIRERDRSVPRNANSV